MYFMQERIKRIVDELKTHIYPNNIPIEKYKMKKGNFFLPAKTSTNTV